MTGPTPQPQHAESRKPACQEPVARILVSACLLGLCTNYLGGHSRQWWAERALAEGWAVPVCPEQAGGLPTPRVPAEIQGNSGEDVLDGRARVTNAAGRDVTRAFVRGAQAALDSARRWGITAAILKTDSPSCGTDRIHDGTFSGELKSGRGVAAALLARNGIRLFNENQIDHEQLAELLKR